MVQKCHFVTIFHFILAIIIIMQTLWLCVCIIFWEVCVTLGNIYHQILPISVPTCIPTSEPPYWPAMGQHVY